MRSFHPGDLVTVLEGTALRDGVVVSAPSLVKVEVVVADADRGPLFRAVHPKVLRERASAGAHDDALREAIQRTAPAGGGGRSVGRAGGRCRPGHGGVSGHRTTGK